MNKIFPTMLIILDVAAALVYMFKDGDWRKSTYWFAAAVLTFAITY